MTKAERESRRRLLLLEPCIGGCPHFKLERRLSRRLLSCGKCHREKCLKQKRNDEPL
jgi:flavoprotein